MQKDHIWVEPINKSELNVYQYGHEKCEAEYMYGPYVRDHYLIHFVTSGKGRFVLNNISYEIEKGSGFIIYPDEITYYQADKTEPWTYRWVGFNGGNCGTILKNMGFSAQNPIFKCDDIDKMREIFSHMKKTEEFTKKGQLKLAGYLYMLFSLMTQSNADTDKIPENPYASSKEYVAGAIDFIVKNYANKITVNDISQYIGLNRSYFGSIFKKHTSKSPQEFLIEFRLDKAVKLMPNAKLNISDIARSVGYEDSMLFCKTFKKHYGMPPTEYRLKREI